MNLADDLVSAARANPSGRALLFESAQITYSELLSQAQAIAGGLYKIGVRKGDRVAVIVGNRPEFIALYYGTLTAGAVCVPINPSLNAHELREPLALVAPRAIVADGSIATQVMSAGPFSAPVFVIGDHPSASRFNELLSDRTAPPVELNSEDLALVAFTAGTKGKPKAAMLTHGNLAANIDQMMSVPQARTEPGDVVLGVLPFHNVFALNVVLGFAVRQKATVSLISSFDPQTVVRAIREHQVSILVGVPPVYAALVAQPSLGREDFAGLKFAVSGAAWLPPSLSKQVNERFGLDIWEGYGLAEASPTVASTRVEDPRPGSAGKPLPGVEIRIVGPEEEDVRLGDPGEVWIRGPNVFSGYFGDEQSTVSAFSDGWFKSGDIGYRDEDDYLWLVGRASDVIVVSGFSVHPSEVERAILSHENVDDVAVVGVADPRMGQRVKAYVVARTGSNSSPEDIIVFCTKNLARFKVPSEVEFLDELPRLPSGKLLRHKLSQANP